jgi:hypothetical protein
VRYTWHNNNLTGIDQLEKWKYENGFFYGGKIKFRTFKKFKESKLKTFMYQDNTLLNS